MILKRDYNAFVAKVQEFKNLVGRDDGFTAYAEITEKEFNQLADVRIKRNRKEGE